MRIFSTLLDFLFILAPALLLAVAAPSGAKGIALSGWLTGLSLGGCVYLVLFWSLWQATPGMLLAGTRLANATTPESPGVARLTLRLLGLVMATLPLGLGLMPALWNRRLQGMHDWIAGTVVLEEDEASKSLTSIVRELA